MAKKRVVVQVVRTQTWALDAEVESPEELQKLVSEIDENHEPPGDWDTLGPGYSIEVLAYPTADAPTWQDISGVYQLSLPPWACE